MKHKKVLAVLTAAGILGATAAANASGLTEKVSGLLRSDVQISVNGEATALHPVYIDGKAYLPVRDAATALGFTVDAQGKQIDISAPKQEEEAQLPQMSGVVTSVSKATEGGSTRLEVRGQGSAQWMIVSADSKTTIVDEAGEVKSVDDIKEGTHITVDYGPIIAMSYPGQSAAAKIVIGENRLIKEDAVSSVQQTENGWQVQLGAPKDANGDISATSVVLGISDETLIVKQNGEEVKPEELKEGTKVRAYYGPIETKSLPPHSAAELLVVLDDDQSAQPMIPAEPPVSEAQ